MTRTLTAFSWPVLAFTLAGLWLACYAFSLALEAPLRVRDEEGEP